MNSKVKFIGVLVGFLAITGVGASVFHFLKEPYNLGFNDFPIITALHIIPGGIYLAIAPFQFVTLIRSRWIDYHRWTGRFLVLIGLLTGASALLIAIAIPFSGWIESVINGFFAILFVFSTIKGYLTVRGGQIALHREWMIRSFAVGLAIATMRLIFIPALIIVGRPTHDQIAMLSIVSFTIAFILHIGIAEIWIRSTRDSSESSLGR
jgi:uncharacterized membrane protein